MKKKILLLCAVLNLAYQYAMERKKSSIPRTPVTVALRIFDPEDKKAIFFKSPPIISQAPFQKEVSLKEVIGFFTSSTRITCFKELQDFALADSNKNLSAYDFQGADDERPLSYWVGDHTNTLILDAYGVRYASFQAVTSPCELY